MGWGNLTKSTRGWIKDNFESIKDKPTRLITGVDPASTGVWNKILGTDDKPLVTAAGGPTSDTLDRVGASKGTRNWYKAADTIASIWGLAGAGSALSGAAGGGGSATAAASEGAAAPAVSGSAGASSLPATIAQYGTGWTPAATSEGVSAGAASSGSAVGPGVEEAATAAKWTKLFDQGGSLMKQQGAQSQRRRDELLADDPNPYIDPTPEQY